MKSVNIVILSVAFGVSGCGSSDIEYKSETIAGFVSSCAAQRGVSLKKCGCLMDSLRTEVSSDTFLKWDTMMNTTGKMPEDFAEAVTNARKDCS